MERIARVDLPLDLLAEHAMNPNEMKDREFDLLVQNMMEADVTDPILVWPQNCLETFSLVLEGFQLQLLAHGTPQAVWEDFFEALREQGVTFLIVGGHHRVKAAQFLDLGQLPASVIIDPAFDEQAADAQLLRHNVIHGQLSPQKFTKLYEKYAQDLPDDVIQEMFGFADSDAFRKLIKDTAAALPPEMKEKFKEGAEDIKTIDDLSKLLNHLFNTYGDTLKHGYMIIDEGGQRNLWLRMSKKTYSATMLLGDACIEAEVTMDQLLGNVVQLIAEGKAPEVLKAALKRAPHHKMPTGLAVLPTEDNLEQIESLSDGE